MEEVWKDIKNYEGIYQVSNLGRIKALERVWYSGRNKSCRKERPEHIMRYRVGVGTGYCLIKLTKDGKEQHCLIHRLVAEAFIPNPNNLPEVNHKDGNKENNRIDNLEWVTSRENKIHAQKNNLIKPRVQFKTRVYLTEKQIKWIRLNYIPRDSEFGGSALAKKFNVDRSVITNIIQGHTFKNII